MSREFDSDMTDSGLLPPEAGPHSAPWPHPNPLVGEQASYVMEDYILGCGTFSTVWLGHIQGSSELQVAVKVFLKERLEPWAREDLEKEITALERLQGHPNIIKLYDVIEDDVCVYLVLEYCVFDLEMLLEMLAERGERLDDHEIRRLFGQLVSAIHYLHQNGVVHRDIKMENVLISPSLDVRLADFGFADFITTNPHDNTKQLFTRCCGSTYTVAPEIVRREAYDGRAVDMWAAGVVLYVMLANKPPFDGSCLVAIFSKIRKGRYPELPPWTSADAKRLVARLLSVSVAQRATAEEVLEHPFLCAAKEPSAGTPKSFATSLAVLCESGSESDGGTSCDAGGCYAEDSEDDGMPESQAVTAY